MKPVDVKVREDHRRFEIGRDCVGWESDSILHAGVRDPEKLRCGSLIYNKRTGLAHAGPPSFWMFSDADRGKDKGKEATARLCVLDESGAPKAEVLMLHAIRAGDMASRAVAVYFLQKDHLSLAHEGVTDEDFERLASQWLFVVATRDWIDGFEVLKAWAEAVDRAIAKEEQMKVFEPDLWRYLRAVEDATRQARGVPIYREVLQNWTERMNADKQPVGNITADRMNKIRKKAGFGWLPRSRPKCAG